MAPIKKSKAGVNVFQARKITSHWVQMSRHVAAVSLSHQLPNTFPTSEDNILMY